MEGLKRSINRLIKTIVLIACIFIVFLGGLGGICLPNANSLAILFWMVCILIALVVSFINLK